MRLILALGFSLTLVAPAAIAGEAPQISESDARFYVRTLYGTMGVGEGEDDRILKGMLFSSACSEIPACTTMACGKLMGKLADRRYRSAPPAELRSSGCPELATLMERDAPPARSTVKTEEAVGAWGQAKFLALASRVRPLLGAAEQSDFDCLVDLSGLSGKKASPHCIAWMKKKWPK